MKKTNEEAKKELQTIWTAFNNKLEEIEREKKIEQAKQIITETIIDYIEKKEDNLARLNQMLCDKIKEII